MKRADGWVRQGVGTLAVLVGFFLLWTLVVGVPLVALSDLVGRFR